MSLGAAMTKRQQILDCRSYKAVAIQTEKLKEAFIILSQMDDKVAAYAVQKVITKLSEQITEFEGRNK